MLLSPCAQPYGGARPSYRSPAWSLRLRRRDPLPALFKYRRDVDSWGTRRQPLWLAIAQAMGWAAIAASRAVATVNDPDLGLGDVVLAMAPAFLAGLALADVLIPRPKHHANNMLSNVG